MPRGGRRSGAPGKAYANRSDLSVNKGPVPVGNFAGSNVPYGTGAALAESQAQMPVSSPQAPAPTAGPPGLPGQPQAPPGPAPGSLGDFHAPTERPGEPITHGLPSGPGGGPEVLATPTTRPALGLLQQVANQPFASDEVRNLLKNLQARGG
jgi:hypothetical protein